MKTILFFLWVLTGTPPMRMAIVSHGCPFGCKDTVQGAVDVAPAYYRVYWHERPALAESLGTKLYEPAVFAIHWPRIRVLAKYHWVKSYATFPIPMSDSLPTGRYYTVTSVDSAGNESCLSNEVLR